jgi:carbamoyltransferase
MYIIGISSFYHDSSACLFKNNKLLFACEEEKFTGKKHDSSFPINTLEYIFKKFKIKDNEIDSICYYENPKLKKERVYKNALEQFLYNPLFSIKSIFKVNKNFKELNKFLLKYPNKVFYSTHHESHLYYSYYTSYFDNAIALSIDGVGETETAVIGIKDKNGINTISIADYPHSLGLFYSAMTSFLGFKPNEGEYKVMGLASYGDPDIYIKQVRELIQYKNTVLRCNMDVFTWNRSSTHMFNENLSYILDLEHRLPDEKIEQCHKDLAASIQKVYEEILFNMINVLYNFDISGNLCLGGGCAYNGTANGKITENTFFNHIWIPTAPSDAGSSIGACIHYLVKNKKLNNKISRNPFLGPQYDYEYFIKKLNQKKVKKFHLTSKMIEHVAQRIKNGQVVGWFQGHCEFGARALGNRSILANPTIKGMKDRINKVIKKREGFRPFAPMVTKEKQSQFFEMIDDIPYMNQIVKVRPEYVDELDTVTHVDGSARVQTVYPHTIIHDLLLEFEKISGYPILLNTSFNIKDKTMVLTPKDAIETFYNTEMDILVMGNYVIYK